MFFFFFFWPHEIFKGFLGRVKVKCQICQSQGTKKQWPQPVEFSRLRADWELHQRTRRVCMHVQMQAQASSRQVDFLNKLGVVEGISVGPRAGEAAIGTRSHMSSKQFVSQQPNNNPLEGLAAMAISCSPTLQSGALDSPSPTVVLQLF